MDRCHGCEGFVPATTTTCPNCDTVCPARPKPRKALMVAAAGAALTTLMACYGGGPINWEIAEEAGSPSVLLDPDNAAFEGGFEYAVSSAALANSAGHSTATTVRVTPLGPDTELLVTLTVEGEGPIEYIVRGSEPWSASICQQDGGFYNASFSGECTETVEAVGFSDCQTDPCVRTVSISLALTAGEAVVERQGTIFVAGVDENEPRGASASVRWVQ